MFPKCWHHDCGAEWWAFPLERGALTGQIEMQFGRFAADVVRMFSLPTESPTPMFWQLALTSHEVEVYRRTDGLAMFRALELFPKAVV
jgi:hypothetical protein